MYIEQKEIGVVEYKSMYFAGVKRLIDKEGSLYGYYYEDSSYQKNWFELDVPMEYHEKFKDIKEISFTDTGIICHGFQKLTECTNRMQELNIQLKKHGNNKQPQIHNKKKLK